jgi:urea transport system permease protein
MIVGQLLINGLVFGGLLAISALGLGLIFGVMRIVNFAHGEIITLGAYTTWIIVTHLGVSPLWGAPAAFVIGAGLGIVLERLIIARVVHRPDLDMLMATYAVSIIGLGVLSQLFGGDFRSYSGGPSGNFQFLGLVVGTRSLTILVICLALVAATLFIVRGTSLGLGLRALSLNRDAAASSGVNVRWIATFVFALASGLAAVAGALISMVNTVSPTLGHDWLLIGFVVIVLGGMGSIGGTLLAALALGIFRSFASFLLDDSWAVIITYCFLYLALLWRPQGMFGRAELQ